MRVIVGHPLPTVCQRAPPQDQGHPKQKLGSIFPNRMGVKRSDLELENHRRGEGGIVREPLRWYAAERQKSAATKYLIELPSTGLTSIATRKLVYATVHPYRTREGSTTPQRRIGWVRRDGGCRDNPQQQMAPRRQGSRVPSLRTVGSLGPRSFSYRRSPRWFESTSFGGS